MEPNPNHKRPVRVAPPREADETEEEFMRSEAATHNRVGLWAEANGMQADLGDENMRPGVEDALAHLKSLPAAMAIQKAREWTGNNGINTLDEAVSAVREALGGQ